MKEPKTPVPSLFKAFVTWLRSRRGIDLFSRISITKPIAFYGIEFTQADAKRLREILDRKPETVSEPEPEPETVPDVATDPPTQPEPETKKTRKNPRNKHPAKSRDAPSEDDPLPDDMF